MKNQKGNILAILTILVLLGGLVAGVILTQGPKILRSKASADRITVAFDTDSIQKTAGDNFSVGVLIKPSSSEVIAADITLEIDGKGLTGSFVPVKDILDKQIAVDSSNYHYFAVNTDKSKVRAGMLQPFSINFSTTNSPNSGKIKFKNVAIVTKTGVVELANIDSSAILSYSVISNDFPTPTPVPSAAAPSTAAPVAPAVTNNVTCVSGSTYSGSEVTVNWQGTGVTRAEIAGDHFSTILASSYPTNYYKKDVTGTSTIAPAGFTKADGSGRVLNLTAGQTVYVRVCTSTQCSPETAFSVPVCLATPPVAPAVTNNVTCVSGSTYSGSEVAFNWQGTGVTVAEIAGYPFSTILSSSYPTNFYQKSVTGNSTMAPAGFTKADGSGRILSLTAGNTLYGRVCNSNAQCSPDVTFSVPACN